MAENHFSNIHLMLAVNLNGNGFSIVINANFATFLRNTNINICHPMVALHIISGIDENLIKYFIEPRDVFDLFELEVGIIIDYPH